MRCIVVTIALAAFGATAFAQEPPAFRQGMWEFKRTVEVDGSAKSATLEDRKCTSPSEDMRHMRELLGRQGCTLTPTARRGNVVSFSMTCTMKGTPVRSDSVMTIESDSAYRVQVTSSAAGRSRRELLVARRVGNC